MGNLSEFDSQVLYKVGEDAISDAFGRAADASDSAQVVLIFPTLREEQLSGINAYIQEDIDIPDECSMIDMHILYHINMYS